MGDSLGETPYPPPDPLPPAGGGARLAPYPYDNVSLPDCHPPGLSGIDP